MKDKNINTIYKTFLFFVLISISSISLEVSANGGPVAWTETTPVGAVGLAQNQQVSLKQEILTIKVRTFNTYTVNAQYTLASSGPVKNLKFGVPVSWSMGENWDVSPKMRARMEKAGPTTAAKNMLSKNIRIQVNGKNQSCMSYQSAKTFKLMEEKDKKFGDYSGILAWCVSSINLNKGKNIIVLQYKAQLDFTDAEYSKSVLTEFSPRKLKYLLYPAGYWDGTVDNVEIKIFPGPYRGLTKFLSPEKFRKVGNIYVWKQKNVDLRKARAVKIEFSEKVPAAHQLTVWNKKSLNNQYTLSLAKKATVTASSILPSGGRNTYIVTNVFDGRPETAWCSNKGEPGEKPYLEIRSRKNLIGTGLKGCHVEGLMLTDGYMKSQAVYMLNNRISKVAISGCKGEMKKVYSLPRNNDYRFSARLIKPIPDEGSYDDRTMDGIMKRQCFRVHILETIKGKANDTCISEVALVVNCG